MERPLSPIIDRTYRKPRLKLPPGACDTHFHFIGPQKQFPLKPKHVFSHLEFEDTPIEDWLRMQDALGLSRGLHVQSMMYESNYEIVLHGQCRFPDRLRAVCIPWPQITDGELAILTKSGVVGYRVTNRLEKTIDTRMIARVHEHGWSIHYLVRSQEAPDDWRKAILASPGRFVLEHMGSIEPDKGLDSIGFKFVLACLDTGRCWVKLSPRVSKQDNFPFDDVLPMCAGLQSSIRAGCCGARTGRIRSTSSRCRTTSTCSTRCWTGCPTRRPATGSSSTIRRSCSDFRRSPAEAASPLPSV